MISDLPDLPPYGVSTFVTLPVCWGCGAAAWASHTRAPIVISAAAIKALVRVSFRDFLAAMSGEPCKRTANTGLRDLRGLRAPWLLG